jgi:hypothetical protein
MLALTYPHQRNQVVTTATFCHKKLVLNVHHLLSTVKAKVPQLLAQTHPSIPKIDFHKAALGE